MVTMQQFKEPVGRIQLKTNTSFTPDILKLHAVLSTAISYQVT